MGTTFPGSTIEVSHLEKDCSRTLFDGIFATGGITLSQVSIMTGLEPFVIQNWVKRKFVSSPVKRFYSRQQFSRILLINMLRESIQIDRICSLIQILGGESEEEFDDLISDEELYHRYVNMLAEMNLQAITADAVRQATSLAVQDYQIPALRDKSQLEKILKVMFYAHSASRLRDAANEMLSTL